MGKQKTIYIVSLNGIKNAGGVEKVTYYLNEILKEKYPVKIITKNKLNFGKLNNLIHPMLISIKLLFLRNKIVIGNSWHCFLYHADFSIHHGTSAGILLRTGEGGFAEKITAKMECISARKAKKILAVSENCKNELIELYKIPESKIYVLNNFVDDEIFSAEVLNKSNKIRILFSGALCNKKGLKKLLDFSNYINQFKDQFELKIASNYSDYKKLFEKNDNTKVLTNLSFNQMPDFYKNGDVLFFPTLYEGFSMAVLEALSSGIPVVGTNFAVSPELQKYDFCKVIDSCESNEKIAEKIINLYSEYSEKRKFIHDIISKDFGKNQYCEKLLEIISNYYQSIND